MGLTNQSTGANALDKTLNLTRNSNTKIIALGGNPNVGKSTIFNGLTGLNQHTGNWPGKTVTNATGSYTFKNFQFTLVDIPGTYSLMANSVEEEVARDFICFGNPDLTVIVLDATCLERNLNLVLQTTEITNNVLVCVNLMDEAKRKGISININKLSMLLGLPVVATSASKGEGLNDLMNSVHNITINKIINIPVKIKYNQAIENSISIIQKVLKPLLNGKINSRWVSLKLLENDKSLIESINMHIGFNIYDNPELTDSIKLAKENLIQNNIDEKNLKDEIVSSLVLKSESISKMVLSVSNSKYNDKDRKIDNIITSKKYGIPLMILLLGIIFWITITGANYPSELLSKFLFSIQDKLTELFVYIGAPSWLEGILIQGMYRTLAWVIAVMLPPMAIFFPLFTLLEDLGYLPRVAFNLDNFFKKSNACGKQALTMCMGFGCNAAGIVGCRIIDSPRERLIAIITNNFVPCNGRFPTLITIITMFFTGIFIGPFRSLASTVLLTLVILLGIFMTLMISKLLSKTILKGIPTTFTLELPPYRKPQIGKIIVRSIFDRTLFVLVRAISVAAPAGIIIWVMANISIGDLSILTHCANFLDPFAHYLGLDGYILMAFILGFPANEIVFPIIIMSYMATGSLLELGSTTELYNLLSANGWTWVTAVSVMLFCLMHWPCSTTCLTIKKETQSFKWTLISFLVPTITGMIICFVFTSTVRLLGLA
ncbi:MULTISPECIES: ferrous iron transport protein B [Clostridium]|uniref:Ferrous iron transport protein B n=1 Tax=Clostridium butyricum E4 str. BoNT E BL5262 TaxID=632245 RepID=C4IJQ5_CLOBU|nr:MULTISPECIES: ferrous iron transport protein B [Clostridium]EDT74501.1 ferrous iron transport protein B [Clostridium butyricum 5521]EEP53504.1 ferrous iron transport protein B [Clostridium butyricum E4 str. BoNT E BL5262]NFL32077.1 ferrous iron transport protein B [Clostridium butyricum]NFS17863.1 ferrous iron transport protein B [Clostridium butyricum]POO88473.1 ferrous iron transport protein B [Clostridium sp. 3-3]